MAPPTQITDETVLEALAAHPETTTANLAEALRIGQSTAAKRLAALEIAGLALRAPGGSQGGRRLPDHWSPAASIPAGATAPPTPQTDHGARPDAAPTEGVGTDADEAPGVDVAKEVDGGKGGRARRLGRGELGSQVRDYLAARPDESFGPSAVGKALGRSQGAISNSLSTMAAKGEVVLVGDKPRRYRIATGG